MKKYKEYIHTIGDKEVRITFNDFAENAHSSVFVQSEDTIVFVAVTTGKTDTDKDYFPLSVDYEEKFYSIGKIGGGQFIRREGRPSESAVLNGRIIDRTIRPLFPKGYKKDVQIVVNIISLGNTSPVALGLLGTSICLSTSHIPFDGPVSIATATVENGIWSNFLKRSSVSDSELTVCGDGEKINMIEMGGNEIPENILLNGIDTLLIELKKLNEFQLEIVNEIGKKKEEINVKECKKEIVDLFNEKIAPTIKQDILSQTDVEAKWKELVSEIDIAPEEKNSAKDYLKFKIDEVVHSLAVDEDKRIDGRKMDEIRPLFAKAGGISRKLHGSGIFYRGNTHILAVLTLDSANKGLFNNSIEQFDTEKNFFLHYNFPPYATGETGRIGFTNRRMIGHGALAEKALRYILPKETDFPYAMRIVSECISSNGSTSMATVCGGTLALMDGGVPIKEAVAGIAMGIMETEKGYKILTDIQGYEDHHGDMDLKVAGTVNGITAMQMDVKIKGITKEILKQAVEKAKLARNAILKVIKDEINEPNKNFNETVPLIGSVTIDQKDIGLVIGKGGETIKEMKLFEGVEEIDIKEDGTVLIYGNEIGIEQVKEKLKEILKKIEPGEKFQAKIVSIKDFGAFASIGEKIEGLIHISELSPQRVKTVGSILNVGDIVPVIVKQIDNRGKIGLSVKDVDPNFFDKVLK